ncbi:MAG: DUF4398 domain-containing protein [Bdellovibrionota bacterium]
MRKVILATLTLLTLTAAGCAIFKTRPVQEMSDTAAALRAAKEVQADTLAPELYRQASEWFQKAKREYKFKNFDLADDYGEQARRFAEQAEFEAIRNGGNRASADVAPDPMANGAPPPPKSAPYDYPAPTPTPADVYDQRKAQDAPPPPPPPSTAPAPAPTIK